MKAAAIIVLAVVGLAACVSAVGGVSDADNWELFKQTYGKSYGSSRRANGLTEEQRRFAIFQSNLRIAEGLQSRGSGAQYGVTKFMDLSPAEFQGLFAGLNAEALAAATSSLPLFIPAAYNNVSANGETSWIRMGLVSSVKNQGSCGSCWAFAAAGAAEGCYAVKYSRAIDLSPQQLIDCYSNDYAHGCDGGSPQYALDWAVANTISTWNGYPYTASQGTCRAVTEVGLPANTCDFYSIKPGDDILSQILAYSQVSVAIDSRPLQYYKGGIISGSTCTDYKTIDHGVLLVADDGGAFTVKNSWGANWGESGFFRVARGPNCLQISKIPSIAFPK